MEVTEPQDIKAGLPQISGKDDGERVPTRLLVGHSPDGTPRWITARLPRSVIGRKALVTIIVDGAGNLVPVWESWAARIRVTETFAEETGIPVSRQTIHAWIKCGFVDGWVPGPTLTWVCLTSLSRFIDQIKAPTAREWWTRERLQAYKDAYDEIRSQGLKARLPHAPKAILAAAAEEEEAEEAAARPRRVEAEQLLMFSEDAFLPPDNPPPRGRGQPHHHNPPA